MLNSTPRRHTRSLQVGQLPLGGAYPVVVQSMNSRPALDIEGNLRELEALAEAGCELSRLAVPNAESLSAFKAIAARSPLPLVADIHFDWRLALGAIEAGASALRLNPGNIREQAGLRQVAQAAKSAGLPIRVGVNSGSLAPEILARFGGVTAEALKESALEAAWLLEEVGFQDICLSVKASQASLMIKANQLLAEACDYPLHLGLTEAGTPKRGVIKSAAALSPLLAAGIGDTIRVSLTADPVEEVRAAWTILEALGLRQRTAQLISCPGCGRTAVDIRPLAQAVEDYLTGIAKPLTIAVMGCAVNGPGEAREADLGLAGGRGEYLLFAKGKPLYKIPEDQALPVLKQEIAKLLGEN
ncbi:MAG: flavodoxin-dependent (E)-4-hydroxy-3-methylbut-2-enyl-diphosphate synthase [Eubacteriales bacterium]|nr:flavodoxin-dependent (E)-4-hydroxy-3-methylbut-2-enyl-diphosphate synthase [Eubacteriales bacterium]